MLELFYVMPKLALNSNTIYVEHRIFLIAEIAIIEF